MQEKIRPEELAVFREAQLKAKLAMQDVEILQLKLFHTYQMREGDQFNAETGLITRAQPPGVNEAETKAMRVAQQIDALKAESEA